MLFRKGDEWHFAYITDFKYVGKGQDVELAKDLDFDFQAGVFQALYWYYRIEEGLDIYPVWEENFCRLISYVNEFIQKYKCEVS